MKGFSKHLSGFGRAIKGLFKSTSKLPSTGQPPTYDAWEQPEARIDFWRRLLEGKTISELIVVKDKSVFGMGGVKKVSPGVIGFVVKGLGPVYIRPGAFGDSFGCFEVALDKDGKAGLLHDEGRNV